MTRDIKYRAYWKPKGEIRDVVDIYFGKKQEVQSVRVLCEHDGMSYPSDDIYVDDFILLQYTGIKDKQGVKIYDGDVVSYPDNGDFIVKYEDGCYWLNGHILGHLNRSGLEVIGNIHEEKK